MLAFISAVKKRLLSMESMDRICPLQPGGFFPPLPAVCPLFLSHRTIIRCGTDELKKEKRVVRGKTNGVKQNASRRGQLLIGWL